MRHQLTKFTENRVYHTLFKIIAELKILMQDPQEEAFAVLETDWGHGKTTAAKKIADEMEDVFYLPFRVPVQKGGYRKLIKKVAETIGVSPRWGVDATEEAISEYLQDRQIVLIIDDAHKYLKKEEIRDLLKSWIELDRMLIVLLGNRGIVNLIAKNEGLFKRMRIYKKLEKISISEFRNYCQKEGIEIKDIYLAKKIVDLANKHHFTTIDVIEAIKTVKKIIQTKKEQIITLEDFERAFTKIIFKES
jgi:replication-associated recombination protein RarA